jgi:hypothetical protein
MRAAAAAARAPRKAPAKTKVCVFGGAVAHTQQITHSSSHTVAHTHSGSHTALHMAPHTPHLLQPLLLLQHCSWHLTHSTCCSPYCSCSTAHDTSHTAPAAASAAPAALHMAPHTPHLLQPLLLLEHALDGAATALQVCLTQRHCPHQGVVQGKVHRLRKRTAGGRQRVQGKGQRVDRAEVRG